MKEYIQLAVPENPNAEKVSVGNFQAELTPGATIETENRQFADYLIENHGLKETGIRQEAEDGDAQPVEEENDFGYPATFPGRSELIAAEIPFESVKGLTVEQLVKVKGIGYKTAESILAFEEETNDGAADTDADNDGAADTDADNGGAN